MTYLDNAATTMMDSEIIDFMHEIMQNQYGNPSSIHALGRNSRVIVENARIIIAKLLNISPAEIFFTSGGTEGINTIVKSVLSMPKIKRVITSPAEHPAMLNAIEYYAAINNVELIMLPLDKKASIIMSDLSNELQKTDGDTFVSLMHANNEFGTMLPIQKIGELCKTHNALFVTDTVQTMGKLRNNFSEWHPDFAIGSAHKFHGPKGVGFMYISGDNKVDPLFIGSQERNMRAGTENIYAIAAMAKAMENAYKIMDENLEKMQELKNYLVNIVSNEFSHIGFNGDIEGGLPNIINLAVEKTPNNEMLLMKFDIAGIMLSGGSACSSGALIDSHVMEAVGRAAKYRAIRVSMSKYTTKNDLDSFIDLLKTI